VLLLNAGLGVKWRSLKCLAHKPQLILWGLSLRAGFPIAMAIALALYNRLSEGPVHYGSLVVALTFIGALPVAGAAPAWAQNVNGNVVLALGLTLVSTLLSPITIPLGIDIAAHLTTGTFASELQHLVNAGTELFLVFAIAAPCAIAVAARATLGEERIAHAMPTLKLVNLTALLLLNYINAAVALPQAMAHPDWPFLVLTVVIICITCLFSFAAGPWLARAFKSRREDGFALMFSMGMCNNGSGLVLVASAFQNHPHALQTLVLYGVIQQLMAGVATRWASRVQANADAHAPAFSVERRHAA